MLNTARLVDHVKWAIRQEEAGYPSGAEDAQPGQILHYQKSWLEVTAPMLDEPVIAQDACGFAACIFGREVLEQPDLVVIVRPGDITNFDERGWDVATSIASVCPRPEGYEGKVLVVPADEEDPEGTRQIMNVAAELLGLADHQAGKLYDGDLRAWSIAVVVAAIAVEEGVVIDYSDLPAEYQVSRNDVEYRLATWYGRITAHRLVEEAYGPLQVTS